MVIHVDTNDQVGPNNQVKHQMKKFYFGTVEDLIHWRQDLQHVPKNKPVKDLKSKFGMEEMLLDADLLVLLR